MNKIFTCNQPIINIYRKSEIKSEVISQILNGEKFYAKNKIKNFLQGYSVHDLYQGYAKFNFFTISNKKKTHKIKSKEAFLYFKPNTKSKTSKKLLFNSKITFTKQKGKFIKSANLRCPKDSKDQQKFFKKKVSIHNIQKGDLLFWKGHVAIAISKTKLIHAFGPKKKVLIMPILQTINTIKENSDLKLLSIKRP